MNTKKTGVCPKCSTVIQEAKANGLWDGRGSKGERIGGPSLSATCSGCGAGLVAFSRVGQDHSELTWMSQLKRMR